MHRPLLLITFFFLFLSFSAQETSGGESDSLKRHSPRKAAILSALLPGAGQIYNKKYWKPPIVYAGMGFTIYLLDDHIKAVRETRQAIINIEDNDPNTMNTTGFPDSALRDRLDARKRNRDQAVLVLSAIYALQIIDAHVDAHLFHFDVGDDLSIQALPSLDFTAQRSIGLRLRLNL